MMAPSGWLGGHPETGELLCFADRSLSAVEHGLLAAHLTECEYCQRELAILEFQARRVSASMATIGSQPVSDLRRAQALAAVRAAAKKVERRRRFSTVYLPKVAAAALIIVAGGLLAGPGLALMRSVFAPRAAEPSLSAPAVVVASDDATIRTSTVRRAFARTEFSLSFEKAVAGSVEFRRHNVDSMSIETPVGSNILVLPNGAVVENVTGASPVVVTLPAGVRQVTVSVAGKPAMVWNPESGILYDLNGLAAGKLTRVTPRK